MINKARDVFKIPDYCSGVPDYKHMKPCCKQHDDDYEHQKGKWSADLEFFKCGWNNANLYYPQNTGTTSRLTALKKRVWARTIACTYYLGVTVFGWLPYYNAGKKK